MARTTRTTAGERTATEVLKQDHQRLLRHFTDFGRVDRQNSHTVREIVEIACLELQIHSLLEEEIFYPAVRAAATAGGEDDLLNESQVEHETVDELIAKLHDLEADDDMYCAYFAVLIHSVTRHVNSEEKALFPLVEQMSGIDLRQLAEEMVNRREELFAELESGDAAADATLDADDDLSAEPVNEDGAKDESFETGAGDEISRTRH